MAESSLLRGEVDGDVREWGSEFAEDTRFTDINGFPIEYVVWDNNNSRVVSGPIGPEHKSKFPGRRFRDRRTARVYWQINAGIVDEYRVPGRYIFRIRGANG